MSKKILIVMPVYNSEKTLGAAIESILKQTHKDFYLVIVDDCSTDSSLDIAKKYLRDKRVHLYRNKENRGAYYSRNIGLYLGSKWDWGFFTTHDSDDISFPNRYADLLVRMEEEKINAVQDMFLRVDLKTGKELRSVLTMAHAVFKRSVFDRIGYFEESRFGADWEYWQRLTFFNRMMGETTVAHKKVVGKSFIHDNNLTVKIPIGSQKRRIYIQLTQRNIRKMIQEKSFYRDIDKEKMVTEKIK
jgi:glycosyltransferase involved in cell wall biosynthesis